MQNAAHIGPGGETFGGQAPAPEEADVTLGEGIKCTQTDDEVEITVKLPEGTTRGDVKVVFHSKSVTVSLAGQAEPLQAGRQPG